MAKVNPIEKENSYVNPNFRFTITVKQLNNVVVKRSQVVSLGGNWKIKWSACPSIWLIFEPAVSPTPNTFRTFRRLCRSLQLVFLKTKEVYNHRRKEKNLIYELLIIYMK